MNILTTEDSSTNSDELQNYYRYHAHIYDATRWSFLFGRKQILEMIPELPSQPRVMEVGCGTGQNMERLEYCLPDAEILGVDLSDEMLNIARNKLMQSPQMRFKKGNYGTHSLGEEPFDLILLSYSLTMIGDDVEMVVKQLLQDLKPRGYVAVVDFHTSPFGWFRHWMQMNHVDLSGELLPLLKTYFRPTDITINNAYMGLWSYFMFVGKNG
ncbi:MAG: class I SAM-dependent methyltransferase [Fodinibius sp.]|nr:class I SAM-dependent methyltransferase [Fodinibius sp.]